MKNNKGFTLVEILASVTILGIISVISIVAYSSYLKTTRQKAYDAMAKSASSAAGEYIMDYVGTESVTLQELVEGQYLEPPMDPSNKDAQCTGKVDITYVSNAIGLDEETFDVTICCALNNYKYHFPGGTKTKLSTCS